MKKILFLLLFPVLVFAQTISLSSTNYGEDVEHYFYAASCDSGTTTSGIFQLDKFNSDLESYPLSFYLYVAENSSSYNPILAVYLEGRNRIGTWNVVDTLYTQDTVTSNITAKGLLTLNASTHGVYPEYRIKSVATTGLGKTFLLKSVIYAYKRD